MKFEDYMMLPPDEADKIAKSGEKIVFDPDTVESLYQDVKNEFQSLPEAAVESSCIVASQMLTLIKEALRAINQNNTDEVLLGLYEMLKAYYKACEERDKCKEHKHHAHEQKP